MITSVNELNKILRRYLIEQGEIDGNNVLNGLSIYGADLQKRIEEQIFGPYDVNNVVVVFELKTLDTTNNCSENDEDEITFNSSYNLHVIMYGDASNDLANVIVARFRTSQVRMQLYDEGIHLVKATTPQSMNEYVNNTLWMRTDFDIEISVRMKLRPVSETSDINSIDNIHITVMN